VIKHVVAFRLENQTPEQERAMHDAFGSLLGNIPEILAFSMGRNISPRDDRFTHSLVSEFADMDAVMAYVNHPLHQDVVKTHLAPFMTDRAIIDYEF